MNPFWRYNIFPRGGEGLVQPATSRWCMYAYDLQSVEASQVVKHIKNINRITHYIQSRNLTLPCFFGTFETKHGAFHGFQVAWASAPRVPMGCSRSLGKSTSPTLGENMEWNTDVSRLTPKRVRKDVWISSRGVILDGVVYKNTCIMYIYV